VESRRIWKPRKLLLKAVSGKNKLLDMLDSQQNSIPPGIWSAHFEGFLHEVTPYVRVNGMEGIS